MCNFPCYVNLCKIVKCCCGFNGCEWFLIFLNKNPFLRSIHLQSKSKWTWINKWMRHFTVVSSDELIHSLHTRVITNTICSAMQLMISWRVKTFLSLFITFRTNIRMSIINLSPCSLLFALHLDWSFNTSVDKKNQCSFCICKNVFHFSL